MHLLASSTPHSDILAVLAERIILNRKDPELTSRTGYAGGTQADKQGRVS